MGRLLIIADVTGRPVIGARVELTLEQRSIESGDTNELGRISFIDLRPGAYVVTAKKDGFEPVANKDAGLAERNVSLELKMIHLLSRADSVEVRGTVVEVETVSKPNTLPPGKVT